MGRDVPLHHQRRGPAKRAAGLPAAGAPGIHSPAGRKWRGQASDAVGRALRGRRRRPGRAPGGQRARAGLPRRTQAPRRPAPARVTAAGAATAATSQPAPKPADQGATATKALRTRRRRRLRPTNGCSRYRITQPVKPNTGGIMKLYQPVLFVGLGGTGCDIGAELERRLREEICGPDGNDFRRKRGQEGLLSYQLPVVPPVRVRGHESGRAGPAAAPGGAGSRARPGGRADRPLRERPGAGRSQLPRAGPQPAAGGRAGWSRAGCRPRRRKSRG